MTALEINGLTKDFGRFRAVDSVTFAVGEGEIVGLLGPNGAGKSTLVHMILGLIRPDGGHLRIFGKDPCREREAVMDRVNFMSPYVGFPVRLTVLENLSVYARLYGLAPARRKVLELLEAFGIADLHDRPLVGLSSGEMARVALCKVFLNDPDLLILDEPLANLDPHAAVQVNDMMVTRQLRRRMSVLLTSHNMIQVEELCDRVIFLDHGRVIACGTPVEVTRTLLNEERAEPALRESFLALGGRTRHAAS